MLEVVAGVDHHVSSRGGRTRLSPSASLAPPTPPHSATTRRRNGALIGTCPLPSGGSARWPWSRARSRQARAPAPPACLRRLAHRQHGGGGDRVGEGRSGSPPARGRWRSGSPRAVDQRGDAGRAERDADGAEPPGAAEAVGDDDADRSPPVRFEPRAQARAERRGRAAAAARARRGRPRLGTFEWSMPALAIT